MHLMTHESDSMAGKRYKSVAVLFVILCVIVSGTTCHAQSVIVPSVPAANREVDELEALKAYLNSHQLYPLYGELLEKELSETTELAARARTATDLAELYAWQLNTDPSQFERLSDRLDELAREFPESTPLITQINIGFGRYRQAKTVFEEWVWDRQNQTLGDQVETRFVNVVQRTTDALASFERQLQNPQLDPGTRRQLETGVSQFRYLAAWARYYRGIAMKDAERQRALLEAAEREFLDLLEVTDSDVLVRMSPQWWSLSSEFTCRLLLGLGMTQQALQRDEQAAYCFNLLNEASVPNSIRDSQRVWRFHSFVFAGQISKADFMVRQWEPNQQAADDIPFWSSVTIAGISGLAGRQDTSTLSELSNGPLASEANIPATSEKTFRNMIRAGLTGLAKSNEFLLIDELHATYPGVPVTGEDFFSQWMNGYSNLKYVSNESAPMSLPEIETETVFPQGSLAIAIEQFRLALASSSNIPPVYRARCRYHFGFAHYADRNFAEAADQFQRASTMLRSLDPILAEHSAWMQCQSLHRLASMDTSLNQSLVFALNEYQKRYPDSGNATQAAFMQVMVQLEDQPGTQAISTLTNIEPGDANYTKALYEICRLQHQTWSQATDETNRLSLAAATEEAAQKYIDEVGSPQVENPQKGNRDSSSIDKFVRICLFAADTRIQSSDIPGAEKWLARTQDLIGRIQSEPELESDYRFMQLNFAFLRGDRTTESKSADWLLMNASRKNHVRAALVSQARLLDQNLKQTMDDGVQDSRLYDSTIDAYQRLAEDFSSQDENWQSNPTALTALLRLAELYTLGGNAKDAKACYATLHQISPRELAYLLGLARSEMTLKEYQSAAGHWRMIASGLRIGHEAWLESKYNLVVCLNESQPATARTVLEQTRLLMPEMSATWTRQFEELEQRLAESP